MVAFAEEQPNAVAHGGIIPPGGRRVVGDTRLLHAPRDSGIQRGGKRLVEIVVNGEVVDSAEVDADNNVHSLEFSVSVQKSSWIALRQFPQLHTNPVNVVVGRQPIRISADSARWCEESVKLLWKNRNNRIAERERAAAKVAYDKAVETYNAAVSKEEEVAGQFNTEIREYKAANPG